MSGKGIQGVIFGLMEADIPVEMQVSQVKHPSLARHRAWMCRCDCGAQIVVAENQLLDGRVRCCGSVACRTLLKEATPR